MKDNAVRIVPDNIPDSKYINPIIKPPGILEYTAIQNTIIPIIIDNDAKVLKIKTIRGLCLSIDIFRLSILFAPINTIFYDF